MSYESHKRWRLNNPEGRNKERKNNYKKTQGKDKNALNRCRWSEEECHLILVRKGMNDRQLHKLLGRSVQAIQVKRTKLIGNKNDPIHN